MTGDKLQIEARKRRILPEAERKEMILDAALEVFADVGYANGDVDQIAHLAGIGKGTIYRYFASKEKLFLALVDRGYEQLHEKMCASSDHTGPIKQRLKNGMAAHVEFFIDNPLYYRIMMLELPDHRLKIGGDIMKRHQRYIEPLVEFIREAMKEKLLKKIDPEFVAITLATISCMIIERYLRGCGKTTKDIDTAVDLFLNGVGK